MKGKHRTWALVLVVFLFGGMALGSGSDDSGPKKVGEVGKTDPSVAPTAAADKGDNGPSSETPEKSEFHVGDRFAVDGLEIVYVASGEYISDNQFLQPSEGKQYIFIELACKNVSDSDKSISAFEFDCYADGYAADSFYGPDDSLSASLSAGRTTSGRLYFDVPREATSIEIEYEYNMFLDKKVLLLYEGEQDSGYVMEANTAASPNAFAVGDVVEGTGLKISYLSCGDCESNNMFITPAEGNKFVFCKFEFENISDSDQMVSSYDFKSYADGMACGSRYFRDDDLGVATISPGRKAIGTVTFEVPVAAMVIEAEFETNYWTSSHIIFTIQ